MEERGHAFSSLTRCPSKRRDGGDGTRTVFFRVLCQIDRTYKALKLSGHNWVGMKEELKKYISECTICQKIKWQRPSNWEDLVEHHLYSVTSLSELSMDTRVRCQKMNQE